MQVEVQINTKSLKQQVQKCIKPSGGLLYTYIY